MLPTVFHVFITKGSEQSLGPEAGALRHAYILKVELKNKQFKYIHDIFLDFSWQGCRNVFSH